MKMQRERVEGCTPDKGGLTRAQRAESKRVKSRETSSGPGSI